MIAGYWFTIKKNGKQVYGLTSLEMERFPSGPDSYAKIFTLPDGTEIEVHHYLQPTWLMLAAACAKSALRFFRRTRSDTMREPPSSTPTNQPPIT